MEAKCLLFDGSPIKVSTGHLLATTIREGKPVLKAKPVRANDSPSLSSIYVSHKSNTLHHVGRLAEQDNIDGLLEYLEKPDLSPVQKVVKVLAFKIKKIANTEILALKLGLNILETGTFPLVMSFACLRQVDSGISSYFNDKIKVLASNLLEAAGRIIKDFLKKQEDSTFHKNVTGVDTRVLSKIDFSLFAAAVYYFSTQFTAYKRTDGSVFTKEAAKEIVQSLFQVFRNVMNAYMASLPKPPLSLSEAATSV
ncbi:hypothetical protein L7F22_005386 [Adiantum nelumboides]|nr:hypothetical protein [Adiantum nelumboides]